MKFVVEPVGEPDKEQTSAKEYWSAQKTDYYKIMQPWSDQMASVIARYNPKSVFEFGCNVGKNLIAIRNRIPSAFLSGIDVNAQAVQFGREEHKLRLAAGDEFALGVIPDRAFDIVFTVSVLDHIATPEPVLAELGRIADKAVLLLEPWLGEEGKVLKNTARNGELIDTTPFSYSWDYARVAQSALPSWKYREQPLQLQSNLGPYYRLFALHRPAPGIRRLFAR